jgi:DNA-directed RNA polymerase sigma subunit (sigma70/sigma32)
MKKEGVQRFTASADRAGLREKELRLWHDWHEQGRKPTDLVPLMQSMESIVQKKLGDKPPEIPRAAYDQNVRLAMIKGIKSFDPSRGVLLTTHVHNNLPRVTEFVAQTRNFSRIPKERFDKYQEFINAQNELSEELGTPPSVAQLQERLQWPKTQNVARLKREIKADLYGEETMEEAGTTLSEGTTPSRVRSLTGVAPALLNKEEHRVFQHLFPQTGTSSTISGIAKTLGIRPDRVYRVRSRIMGKLKPHLDKL